MKREENLDFQISTPYFVLERTPNPDWEMRNRVNHGFYVLGYAKSGEAFYDVGHSRYTITKGNILFMPPEVSYTAHSSPDNPWAFYSCGFSLKPCDAVSAAHLSTIPPIVRCTDTARIAENLAELNRVWMLRSTGFSMKCRSLLLDVLFLLIQDEERRQFQSAHFRQIQSIMEMMRKNPARNDTLQELSALSGLSVSHFCMLFKQVSGMSVVQFRHHMKIERAKDLLLSGSCNVSEAANAVGFSDVYYFSRLFKQLTGTTPSAYRPTNA